jgi:hypothetical protein
MTIVRSLALFAVAAFAEIGGAWLIWQSVREHRPAARDERRPFARIDADAPRVAHAQPCGKGGENTGAGHAQPDRRQDRPVENGNRTHADDGGQRPACSQHQRGDKEQLRPPRHRPGRPGIEPQAGVAGTAPLHDAAPPESQHQPRQVEPEGEGGNHCAVSAPQPSSADPSAADTASCAVSCAADGTAQQLSPRHASRPSLTATAAM